MLCEAHIFQGTTYWKQDQTLKKLLCSSYSEKHVKSCLFLQIKLLTAACTQMLPSLNWELRYIWPPSLTPIALVTLYLYSVSLFASDASLLWVCFVCGFCYASLSRSGNVSLHHIGNFPLYSLYQLYMEECLAWNQQTPVDEWASETQKLLKC